MEHGHAVEGHGRSSGRWLPIWLVISAGAAACGADLTTIGDSEHALVQGAEYTCLPQACPVDQAGNYDWGRIRYTQQFLSMVGINMASFSDSPIELLFSVPKGKLYFEIGVFDGDAGSAADGTPSRPQDGLWDTAIADVAYTLYADPAGDGSGWEVVAEWMGNREMPLAGDNGLGRWSSAQTFMPDDAWYDVRVLTDRAARNPSTLDYNYRLEVQYVLPEVAGVNRFALRTTGRLRFDDRQSYGVIAGGSWLKSYELLNPGWKQTDPWADVCNYESGYSGEWKYSFFVPPNTASLEFWDGDFDFGSDLAGTADTDDPNTPNELPPFASGGGTRPEDAYGLGRPEDDSPACQQRRSPSVVYQVVDPGGTVYANDNPSGSEEWERFTIGTDPTDDHVVPRVASGMYTVRIFGLDIHNSVWLRTGYSLCADRDACVPPGVGTGTPGFWKNHADAWPVDSITIGGVVYTKAEAIEILNSKSRGDMTHAMFRDLVSAKLNLAAGNFAACIEETIRLADEWMARFGPVGSGVAAGGKNSPWRIGEPLHIKLDSYNNGLLCAPHRG